VDVARALKSLGCDPSPSFRSFYERHAGPFSSEHSGFSLLDVVDQDVNIATQTEECRTQFGFPKRYLVLSDLVGNAALVYDCVTDAVFNVDFEGADESLVAGTLEPRWDSFDKFLASYFLGADEQAMTLDEALARTLSWRKTRDVDHPWETIVDGRIWRVRLGDFPAEKAYTLLVDDEEIGSFDDWPSATWTRPATK
jgi:hypothetical protein